MRGEFIRGDGLVLPNNITLHGARTILASAFRSTAFVYQFQIGLCNAVFTPGLKLSDMEVSTPNGQAGLDIASWMVDELNGEAYAESAPVVFPAIDYGAPVTRCFIRQTVSPDLVVALGSPFPAPLTLRPSTPAAQRTFRYRLYLR
jgi:hypothetical protein